MRNWIIALVILAGIFWWRHSMQSAAVDSIESADENVVSQVEHSNHASLQISKPKSTPVIHKSNHLEVVALAPASNPLVVQRPRSVQISKDPSSQKRKERLVHFELEDGLAVAEVDLVLGVPVDPSVTSGLGTLPVTDIWPGGIVPYFIQPGVPNPERIHRAISLFAGTPIQFVPYNGQEDALVFQEGQGACKSYVGHVGGKQPIWLSGGCGASEIAHEMMHALGFIHEQNRSDRDSYLEMDFDNIDDKNRINFEKMSDAMMHLSGLSDFDYTSIMIYPDTMFSRNGGPTMRSIRQGQLIEHAERLSEKDISRLVRGYGHARTPGAGSENQD